MKSFLRTLSLTLIICLAVSASIVVGLAYTPELYDYFAAEEVKDAYGNVFDNSVLLKRPSIVNVWATWCGPCVGEIPALSQISAEYAGRVNVIGIQLDAVDGNLSVDQNALAAARDLLNQNVTIYPSIIPSKAIMDCIYTKNVNAIPTTWFVDASGKIVREEVGSKDLQGWQQAVEAFLKEYPVKGE